MEHVRVATDESAPPRQDLGHGSRRKVEVRSLNFWALTLLAFPLAGLAGRAVAGPVDEVWTVLRRIGVDARWIATTAAGLGVGLGLAFAIFGYGDTVGDLAVVGAVTGLFVGIAQWWLLRDVLDGSLVWIPASAASWALGWTVTTAIGVDPADRWAVPGLSGAATVTLLLGAVLWMLARHGVRDRDE
jgi:hypothetical protein